MNKVPCPICRRMIEDDPVAWPQFPFCGKRCRTIDLGRWLGEQYRIPTAEPSASKEADAKAAASDDQNP